MPQEMYVLQHSYALRSGCDETKLLGCSPRKRRHNRQSNCTEHFPFFVSTPGTSTLTNTSWMKNAGPKDSARSLDRETVRLMTVF